MMFDPDELPLDEMEESPLKTNKPSLPENHPSLPENRFSFRRFPKKLDGFLAGTS